MSQRKKNFMYVRNYLMTDQSLHLRGILRLLYNDFIVELTL